MLHVTSNIELVFVFLSIPHHQLFSIFLPLGSKQAFSQSRTSEATILNPILNVKTVDHRSYVAAHTVS